MKAELFNHQRDALHYLDGRPEAAITADMGTGKSRIVIEDAKRLGAAMFIVCSKTALSVWRKELDKWGPINAATVNYESLWRPIGQKMVASFFRKSRKLGQPIMLILDESHRIKDRTTKQSKACRSLARNKQVLYRRILTGTPVVNGVQDLWAQYDFLNPQVLGKWGAFSHEHLIFNPMFPSKVEGTRNLLELQEKTAPHTFHVSLSVLDLPESTDLYRTCRLTGEDRKAYDSMEKHLVAQIGNEDVMAKNTLVKIIRLAQIVGGQDKLELLSGVLDEIGNEPFLIFTRFLKDHRNALKVVVDRGFSCGSIAGGVIEKDRAAAIQDLWDGRLRALVIQLAAGAESIDLTPARYAIYYSVGFSFQQYAQSKARILRAGQTRPCFYIHLLAENTIDEHIYKALTKKEGWHDAVQSWWRDQNGQTCW